LSGSKSIATRFATFRRQRKQPVRCARQLPHQVAFPARLRRATPQVAVLLDPSVLLDVGDCAGAPPDRGPFGGYYCFPNVAAIRASSLSLLLTTCFVFVLASLNRQARTHVFHLLLGLPAWAQSPCRNHFLSCVLDSCSISSIASSIMTMQLSLELLTWLASRASMNNRFRQNRSNQIGLGVHISLNSRALN
jgi:hypothetical protein